LCLLRYPGWTLMNMDEIPGHILNYIAQQIQVDPEVFSQYAQRGPTLREHLQEIRQGYGYRNFTLNEYRNISRFLVQRAMENNSTIHLLQTAIDEMRQQKIILPNITTL